MQKAEVHEYGRDKTPDLAVAHLRQAGIHIVGDQEGLKCLNIGAEAGVKPYQNTDGDETVGQPRVVTGYHLRLFRPGHFDPVTFAQGDLAAVQGGEAAAFDVHFIGLVINLVATGIGHLDIDDLVENPAEYEGSDGDDIWDVLQGR